MIMQNTNVNTETLWHYTTLSCLLQIIESGFIKRATAGVPKGEKPVVWFSTNQDWENTCNKGIVDYSHPHGSRRATKDEMIQMCGGLARIGVNKITAPYNWQQFKKIGRVNPLTAKGLVSTAIKMGGDPNEWRVAFKPIVKKHWTDVQIWDDENQTWESVWNKEAGELSIAE